MHIQNCHTLSQIRNMQTPHVCTRTETDRQPAEKIDSTITEGQYNREAHFILRCYFYQPVQIRPGGILNNDAGAKTFALRRKDAKI